jgi:murein DD-endopeptidase MepM/ murein hydrolase activator NlpD
LDRYFTVMFVPEREKGVRSFRIPRIVFRALVFLAALVVITISVLGFDYIKILGEIEKNNHLTKKNQLLQDQIDSFQTKIHYLSKDIERIHVFEKKLRIITGLDQTDLTGAIQEGTEVDGAADESSPKNGSSKAKDPQGNVPSKNFRNLNQLKNFSNNSKYLEWRSHYEQKIASYFSRSEGYIYTKEWSDLTQQSFALADQFAEIHFKFNHVKSFVEELETDVHSLDQYLLDKESFLKSTPTLIPAKGWITSYYGPRLSPTSKRWRMHEGLDIGAKRGSPIVSPADGVITFAGIKPGFGKFVQIDHGYGVETIYAHAKSLSVKKGQQIARGVKIASIGNTGSSTGPHLHYEVRVNGTPVDPLFYTLDR